MFAVAMALSLYSVSAKNPPKLDAELVKLIEKNKQTELQDFLKKKKQSVDAKNAALWLAVEKNRVKIACMLINNEANPRVKDENGITSLMIAAINNYPSMAGLLMKMEGGPRIKDNDGNYAATHAIRRNNMEVYNVLWNFKCSEIHNRRHLAEILISTLKLNRPEMAKILINDRFKSIPKEDMTEALIIAARKGYLDIAKLLIEKGADINAADSCGYSILMEACRSGHIDIAKYLIEKGADVNARDMFSRTALMFANNTNRSEEDCIKLMKLLIENGADTEVENKLTRTVLLQAAIGSRFTIVKFLIKNGANVLFAKYRRPPNVFVMDRKTKQTVIGCLIKSAFKKVSDFVKKKIV